MTPGDSGMLPTVPMRFTSARTGVCDMPGDVVVVPFANGRPGPGGEEALRAIGLDLASALRAAGSRPRPGDVVRVPASSGLASPALALVCVEDGHADPRALREAGAAAGRACRDAAHIVTTLHQLGDGSHDAIRALADGLAWGCYEHLLYRTDGQGRAVEHEVTFLFAPDDLRVSDDVHDGVRVAAADWVRDMVNAPPGDATPAVLAAQAAERTETSGVTCRIWRQDELRAGGFNAILAVGGGSANEPCMLEMRYSGGGPAVALVGKGITFDTGGLDLKGIKRMVEMKADMAGAAAVIATTHAAAQLGLRVNLHAIVPLAENMVSGTAVRPQDVLRHPDGSTTEVISPDSEGRLVLADALCHATAGDPEMIVDVATLTGNTGLGNEVWAVLANDDELADQLLEAGRRAGEPGWRLPLWQPYRRFMESAIADRSNNDWAGPYAPSTVIGGLFLEPFVKSRRWAHLDIAATAVRTGEEAPAWMPLGPTSNPTATLLAWLDAIAVAS